MPEAELHTPDPVGTATAHAEAVEAVRAEQLNKILKETREETLRITTEAFKSSEKTIELLKESLLKHFKDDAAFQETTIERFAGLATKDDTKEILGAIKTVHIGFGFVKIGWRSFLAAGTIAGALIAIITFGKIFLAWLIAIVIKIK